MHNLRKIGISRFLLLTSILNFATARKISLVFVADATNSMQDDLDQLRVASSKIINDLATRGDRPIKNYVLSIFRDREVDPILNTTNSEDIKNSLLGVHLGGGRNGNPDCPEHSMHGIKEALPYALPNSLIYVFTDDDANDYQLEKEISEVLRKKQISVSFLLTYGSCTRMMNSSRPGFSVYERLAKETNGQVFSMDKNGVEKVMVAIADKLNPKYADLSRKDYAVPGTNRENMTIDSSMSKLVITATGKDTKLTANDPKNVTHQGQPLSKNSQILVVPNPESGAWNIESRATSPYSTQVAGLSEVNFDYGFSLRTPNKQEETLYQPIKGSKNILSIYVSNATQIDQLMSAKLVESERQSLVTLQKVRDDLYITPPIDIPQNPFKIGIEGADKNKNDLKRILSTSLEPSEPTHEDLMKTTRASSKYKKDLDHLYTGTPQQEQEVVKLLVEWGFGAVVQEFLDAKLTIEMMKNSLTDGMIEDIFDGYPPGIIIIFMEKLKAWRIQNTSKRP